MPSLRCARPWSLHLPSAARQKVLRTRGGYVGARRLAQPAPQAGAAAGSGGPGSPGAVVATGGGGIGGAEGVTGTSPDGVGTKR